jgi:hypothetical protein
MRIAAVVAVVALTSCFNPVSERDALTQGAAPATTGTSNNELCSTITVHDPTDAAQPAGPCLCTRRDAVPAGDCARGVGETASATIGPEGGTVTLMGQQGHSSGVAFSITFPPGSIRTPTVITVTETTQAPPAGMVDWSPVFRVDPVGLELAEPARVKVPFNQGRGSAVGSPALFWSNAATCGLERLPSSYSNAGFNQGNVGRLGYAISGYANPGQATACR